MKIYKTAKTVKSILESFPETRDNDYLLWLKMIELHSSNPCENYQAMTVGEFLQIAKASVVPCFETVSRARRKIQAQNPELKASPEVEDARAEMEVEYKEFARDKDVI